jgi:hypothetical protein
MPRTYSISVLVVVFSVIAGCVTPAPGADQVKFTNNPADVSECVGVGNINAEAMNNLDPHVAQNLAVGLNANVVFRTGASGVAYHCGNTAVPR